MAEERDPFPTEDPREKGVSDQNAEESPGPDESGPPPEAPGASDEDEHEDESE